MFRQVPRENSKSAALYVKHWYAKLLKEANDSTIEAFRDRTDIVDKQFKLRLSCTIHKDFPYLMGYTGKYYENLDLYVESGVGYTDERWAECMAAYWSKANDENAHKANAKKPYNPRPGTPPTAACE